MKKIVNRLCSLVALFLVSASLVSCADNVIDEPTNSDGTYTMTVTATKDSPTKALAPSGSTLTASWSENDAVQVYKGEALIGTLYAQSPGATTKLKGDISTPLSEGSILTLKYLSPNYATQDGTLTGSATSIDKVCDYATASVTVASVADGKITTTQTATFVNQQAIVKFTLNASDGTTLINTTQLTVSDGTSTVSLTDIPDATYTKNGNGVLYVTFPAAGSAKTITLTVTNEGKHFVYEKSGVTFSNGKFYEITVRFGALSGAGTVEDPYLISSEADWNYLANTVNSGTNYAGKFFLQKTDISVMTMVGVNETNSFCGTYDGGGQTLTVTLNTADRYVAPFHYVKNATIKNLAVTGTIDVSGSGDYSTRRHAGGLVGLAIESCVIRNCRVSVNISGTDFMGGIVGDCGYTTITLSGCAFNGNLTVSGNEKAGGLIGWGGDKSGVTVTIENCLFAGTHTAPNDSKFHPIGCYNNPIQSSRTVSNTYYLVSAKVITDNDSDCIVKGLASKGKFARSITAGTDVTVANAGAATVYNVSGITSYGTGILYDGTLYAGNGEAVSLTLSHTAAPTGYTFNQYTVTGGGSLNNPTTNSPTLTMTDADQTINVEWAFNTLTFNYTGAVQTFTVPATGYYTLECYGAQGGYASSGLGGKGGLSQLTYSLTQGDVLYIYVGGQGECIDGSSAHPEGGYGGWNGGGKGGTGVAWGGGNGVQNSEHDHPVSRPTIH